MAVAWARTICFSASRSLAISNEKERAMRHLRVANEFDFHLLYGGVPEEVRQGPARFFRIERVQADVLHARSSVERSRELRDVARAGRDLGTSRTCGRRPSIAGLAEQLLERHRAFCLGVV